MTEVTLSNGEPLDVPDDYDETATQRAVNNAEALIQEEGGAAPERPWYQGGWLPESVQRGAKDVGSFLSGDFLPQGVRQTINEHVSGVMDTAVELPNIIPALANSAQRILHTAPGIGSDTPIKPEDQFQPWFDMSAQHRGINQVDAPTPGYEGVREAGRKYTGPIVAGFLTGGPLGAGLAAGSEITSAGLGQLGRLADYELENKTPRYQTFAEETGNILPAAVAPLSVRSTKKGYSGPETPEIAAAAKRQDVKPNLPLLAGSRGKTAKLTQKEYSDMLGGLERLNEGNVEAMKNRFPNQERIDPSKETLGTKAQELSSRAEETVSKKIGTEQDKLTAAAGGEYAIHDPSSLMKHLDDTINDARSTAKEKEQAKEVRAELKRNFIPKDAALETTLQAQLRSAKRPTDVNRIKQQIAANRGVNEDAMRKFTSDIKSRAENANDALSGYDYKKIGKAGEEVRRSAAEARGFSRDDWNKIQQEAAPAYKQRDILEKRGVDPNELKSDADYYFGPSGDTAPARLKALQEEDPAGLATLLAAQYEAKTRDLTQSGSRVTPESLSRGASWNSTLGPGGREIRYGPQGDLLRRNNEDEEILARNAPAASSQTANTGSGGQRLLSATAAAATGSPIPLMLTPGWLGGVQQAGRTLTGTPKPVDALMMNGQDIASLLARSATAPGIQALDDQPGARPRRRGVGGAGAY